MKTLLLTGLVVIPLLSLVFILACFIWELWAIGRDIDRGGAP